MHSALESNHHPKLFRTAAYRLITCFCFLVFSCLIVATSVASADSPEPPKRVLLLHAYHHGNKWTDDETRGLMTVLGKNRPGFQLDIEYMDTKKLASKEYFALLAGVYRQKYGSTRFDVIIAADDNAFFFLRERRDSLFPGVPVVFCGVNFFQDSYLAGVNGFTGVNEEADLKGAIDVALSLHPGTKNMVLITDATETGQRISARFRELIPLYDNKVHFRILDDLPMATIQAEVGRLRSGSLVLFTFFFKDATGKYFEYYESPLLIAEKCRVPIYGAWDYSLGYGIVGGLLTSGFDQGSVAGKMAMRILAGESVDTIPVVKNSPNRYFFDYPQLTKFGIRTSDLPTGSTIINAPNISYLINKVTVWTALIGISVLVFFVAFLLINTAKRKKAEAAFRTSEQNYHTLVDNLRVGVFRSSPELEHGNFLQVNQAMQSIFGFKKAEDFRAIPVSSLYQNPEDRRQLFSEIIEKGYIKDRELAMRRKDDTPIIVSCTATVQYDDKGAVKWLDGVMEDITERKSLEDQLRQAQKMEAVGTLAGGIAHDFNNLLTALIGYANLAKIVTDPDDDRHVHITHILSCAEKAAKLTRGLLAFSRKQVINPKAVNPSAIINQIKPLLERLLGEEIDLQIAFSDESLCILADANQIEQVIMNLVTNAKDAMPDGGKLSIVTSRYDCTGSILPTVSTNLSKGSYALICVSDTGVGMPEAVREKIFEPFFTTKEMSRGTGLGLSTAYGIIKQHGGEIEVSSRQGRGTAFRIYLPLHRLEASSCKAPLETRQLRGGDETILVAEDDSDVRGLIVNVLSMSGYTVIEAVDGEDAVSQFTRHHEHIDLILTDVIMPKLNGKEAVAQINAIRPHVKVLFMSGYTADVIHQKMILDEDVNFVFKPIAPAPLLDKIRSILDSADSTPSS